MVRVRIHKSQDIVEEVNVTGHANFAEHGQDLVCSGVSSIVFGMMNAIDSYNKDCCSFQVSDANIKVTVKHNSDTLQVLLQALVIQLKTVEESYPAYIKIQMKEVNS